MQEFIQIKELFKTVFKRRRKKNQFCFVFSPYDFFTPFFSIQTAESSSVLSSMVLSASSSEFLVSSGSITVDLLSASEASLRVEVSGVGRVT